MSALSLKALLRKRVMDDMIKAVQPETKWKLLVVDSNSAKLLSTICKSHEILQENVTVIEDMSLKRQPFPNYEAIYFVTASARTIDRIIADFKQDKPIYLAAHLFFTSSLDDELFDKFKKSGILKYIKGCKEMNIDFIALEQQVFSLDLPLSLFPLYAPAAFPAQGAELKRISKKLISLMNTLGDSPFIRYYDPTGSKDGLCAKLANMVHKEMKDLSEKDDAFPVKTDYRRTILIILDRTFDMMAPFLQEFTYQALLNDLVCGEKARPLELAGGINNPAYFLPNPTYSVLDESDSIWMLIRHWHFAEAVDHILNSFNKFMNENKAASTAAGNQGARKVTGLDALKAMKDTLSALPQFQSLKAKYSIHISVSQECKAMFEKRSLDLVASVQQDLATGETSGGKPLKNAMLDLITVLDNKKTSSDDKLRALLIYIIAMNGVQDLERKRLLETAKISIEDSQCITNLALFDVSLVAGQENRKSKDKKYTYWGSYKQERKKKKANADDLPYDLSRYVPLMKRLLEDQITNSIPKETFPWIEEPKDADLGITPNTLKMFRFTTSTGLVPPDPNYPHSLRTTRASWAGKGRDKKQKAEEKSDQVDLRVNGSRIILFSLGGLTYSELRSVYEVSRDSQREIYIGSTFVYNPAQFIDVLKNLHITEVPQLHTSPTAAELPKEEKKGGLFGKKK